MQTTVLQIAKRTYSSIPEAKNFGWVEWVNIAACVVVGSFVLAEPTKVVVRNVNNQRIALIGQKPPANLSKLFENGSALGSMAIGAAEDNNTPAGVDNPNIQGHKDPGNDVQNIGRCSLQRYLWGKSSISVEEANEKCAERHRYFLKLAVNKFEGLGIEPSGHVEGIINAVDMGNQAAPAVADAFPGAYKRAIAKGLDHTSAVLNARVESFRHNGVLDASGLFRICRNPNNALGQGLPGEPYSEEWRYGCIERDQKRRVDAIAKTLQILGKQ
jgi:hypothetical protein